MSMPRQVSRFLASLLVPALVAGGLGCASSQSGGTTGSAGTTGNTGPAGSAGSAGKTGTAGTTGNTGSGGVGSTGAAGTLGAGGTAGPASGTAGTTGSAGTTGLTGAGGSTGSSGTAGTSGTTGRAGTSGTAGTQGAGGKAGTTGTTGTAGTSGAAGTTGAGGQAGGVPTPDGGFGSTDAGACSSALADRVRVTEIDVGTTYDYNEVDNNGAGLGLTPLAISPIPGGGSRLAFLGKSDGIVHVVTLDANDQVVAGSAFTLPGYDVQDIYADTSGGVLLIGRDAQGGTTANHNCGTVSNLCGLTANLPSTASCYDMYMVRFDGASETWATKLTDTTASLPAYMSGPTATGQTDFIWSEYAHNGRIAFDGTNYAGYFGIAISVSQACVGSSTLTTGVNIHQGDRMKVVSGTGALLTTPGFGLGCSHSGYERVIWDPTAKKFVPVCKNDAPTGGKSGRIALAPNTSTIYPVDLNYSDLGNVMVAGGGGYWIITSDIRTGQTANSDGLADVHLLHMPSLTTLTPDQNLMLVSDAENDRAPHLAAYGTGQLLAAWEESTATGDFNQTDKNRQMYLQILDATSGAAPAGSSATTAGPLKLTPNLLGSRYQDFRAYSDGSVAYPAPGSTGTKIKILRVLGCK